MIASKVILRLLGDFPREKVQTRWVADSRPRVPEIEQAIQRFWDETQKKRSPDRQLIDAPLCRLENVTGGEILQLSFSPTSYKIFIGTHLGMMSPQSPGQCPGRSSGRLHSSPLSNALGISALVRTSDNFFVLGVRSVAVAHYPHRLHPFAGMLEPREPMDVFAEMHRELHEEAGINSGDIKMITCLGLAEDPTLRQPELIFLVHTSHTKDQIKQALDQYEHTETVNIAAIDASVAEALSNSALTPIACGALLMCGRHIFGPRWFDEVGGSDTLMPYETR